MLSQETATPAEVVSPFYTPAEVSKILKISPNATISRFAGMAGVLVLPSEGKPMKRERYRTIRVPKHVLDRFIETNTVQANTLLSMARNRRKVRRSVQ